MERDPNDGFGASGASQGGNTSGFGGSSSSDAGSLGGGSLSGGSTGGAGSYGASSAGTSDLGTSSTLGERDDYAGTGAGSAGSAGTSAGARDRMHQAREKAGQALGQARDKAGELKVSLADRLESGAERLRQRGGAGSTGTLAAAGVDTGTTEVAGQSDPMAQVNDRLATGMKSTADWLRNNDLDSMRASVESEVRTNPGRSLLVAAVAGYLLARAFRR